MLVDSEKRHNGAVGTYNTLIVSRRWCRVGSWPRSRGRRWGPGGWRISTARFLVPVATLLLVHIRTGTLPVSPVSLFFLTVGIPSVLEADVFSGSMLLDEVILAVDSPSRPGCLIGAFITNIVLKRVTASRSFVASPSIIIDGNTDPRVGFGTSSVTDSDSLGTGILVIVRVSLSCTHFFLTETIKGSAGFRGSLNQARVASGTLVVVDLLELVIILVELDLAGNNRLLCRWIGRGWLATSIQRKALGKMTVHRNITVGSRTTVSVVGTLRPDHGTILSERASILLTTSVVTAADTLVSFTTVILGSRVLTLEVFT
jgi:hypothetical protein